MIKKHILFKHLDKIDGIVVEDLGEELRITIAGYKYTVQFAPLYIKVYPQMGFEGKGAAFFTRIDDKYELRKWLNLLKTCDKAVRKQTEFRFSR